jgi:hypothetical protein
MRPKYLFQPTNRKPRCLLCLYDRHKEALAYDFAGQYLHEKRHRLTVREREDDKGDPEEVDLTASYSTFDDFNLITGQSRELQPVEFLFESMKHIVIDFTCTPQVMQL